MNKYANVFIGNSSGRFGTVTAIKCAARISKAATDFLFMSKQYGGI